MPNMPLSDDNNNESKEANNILNVYPRKRGADPPGRRLPPPLMLPSSCKEHNNECATASVVSATELAMKLNDERRGSLPEAKQHNFQRDGAIQNSPSAAYEESSSEVLIIPENRQGGASHVANATFLPVIAERKGSRPSLASPLLYLKRGLRHKHNSRKASIPSTTKRSLRRKPDASQRGSGVSPPLVKGGLRRKRLPQDAQRASRPRSGSGTKTTTDEEGSRMRRLRGLAKNREQAMNAAPGHGSTENTTPQRESRSEGSDLEDAEQSTESSENQLDAPHRPDESLEFDVGHDDDTHESSYRLDNNICETEAPEQASYLLPDGNGDEFFPGAVFLRAEDDQSSRSSAQSTGAPHQNDEGFQEDDSEMASVDVEPPQEYDMPHGLLTPIAPTSLVEATPVEDLEVGEAHEVDPEELQRVEERARKARECRRCGMALIGLSTLIMVLTVLFAQEDPTVVFETRSPTPTPQEHSIAPTGTPTIVALLETLQLLNATLNAAQLAAIDWLLSHPTFPTMEPWRQRQLFALATFYWSLSGPNWPGAINGWMRSQGDDECEEWYSYAYLGTDYYAELEGVEYVPRERRDAKNASICTDEGHYLYLGLSGVNGIEGTVPSDVALLTDLKGLAIRSSDLSSPLESLMPSELLRLSNLTVIDFLWNNNVYGSIPAIIGGLEALQSFLASRNKISGTIPTQICQLSNLRYLQLETNQLNGALPMGEGCLLTSLEELYLSRNQLSSSIPDFSKSSELDFLFLSVNALTGTIRTELGLLTKLEHLNVGSNMLVGSLPSELALCSLLRYLEVSNNSLSGPIPRSLPRSLTSLYLHQNMLTGAIPSEIFSLSSLEWLNIRSNSLSAIPAPQIGQLGNLTALIASENKLSNLPKELCRLRNLQDLDLLGNRMEGPLPSQLGLLEQLEYLDLEGNVLTGSIPVALVQPSSLASLYLSSNLLHGNLPLPNRNCSWQIFTAGDNLLSGTVHTEVGHLTAMKRLELQQNLLTGVLPTELGSLNSTIQWLDMSHNLLSGTIPTELGQMKDLAFLYLEHNPNLFGTVPSELGLLTALEDLFIDHTLLTGRIPAEVCALPYLTRIVASCSSIKCGCISCNCEY